MSCGLGREDPWLGCQLSALDGVPLMSALTVKGLGVNLDASISMEVQVTNGGPGG